MTGMILVDTNVVAYAYDRSEPVKQRAALAVLSSLVAGSKGALSVQVLAELFVVLTRKLAAPLVAAEAYEIVQNYMQSWTMLDHTPLIVLEAARGVRDYQFNYWDAQIWAAARLNQIDTILSEDFNTGAMIEGVRFVNPFVEDFVQGDW
jgi:predicted nucleic acid-binding protein